MTAERLVLGRERQARAGRGALRRRAARAATTFLVVGLVLCWLTVVTARSEVPPPLPPVATAAFPVVPAWEQHLPYAAVDRTRTVVRTGNRRLDGEVVSPRGAPSGLPGVVLVGGRGSAAHAALLGAAEVLARGGVVALLPAAVDAVPAWSDDGGRVDDVVAGVDVLTGWSGVDPARVGVLGVGEGGWVAPLAAQRASGRVAFTVLVSAPVVTPGERDAWVLDRSLAGAPGLVRSAPAVGLSALRGLARSLDTDVVPALAATTVPVYAVWGAQDRTLPVAAALARVQAVAADRLSAEIIPGAGHTISVTTGWADRVADWVRRGEPLDSRVRGAPPATYAAPAPLPRLWVLGDVRAAVGLSVAAALVAGLLPARARRRRVGHRAPAPEVGLPPG